MTFACLLAGVASACSSSSSPSLKSAKNVVFVGDSLALEASQYLPALLQTRTFVPEVFGGTAPCDWVEKNLAIPAESVVVISFIGNSLTPCMSDGAGGFLSGQALIDKYRADLQALIEQARSAGAPVLLVNQPKTSDRVDLAFVAADLNATYQDLASADDVAIVDAGAAVENPDGTFADELPCAAAEQACGASGSNVVRTDDGVHFCPGPSPAYPCPVYASGAFRFAQAIADAIVNS
ncbi:hypothetical protein BH10ACT2_BH10ACT2_14610 [soil metagenome]